MRGLAIFYGCISLLLFVVMAGIKPSHVARNGPTYRSVESAVSSREQVMATPAVQESAMKAVRGRWLESGRTPVDRHEEANITECSFQPRAVSKEEPHDLGYLRRFPAAADAVDADDRAWL
jgi:hypothetical protein